MNINTLAKKLAVFFGENFDFDQDEMEEALKPFLSKELTTYLPEEKAKETTPSPSEKGQDVPDALIRHLPTVILRSTTQVTLSGILESRQSQWVHGYIVDPEDEACDLPAKMFQTIEGALAYIDEVISGQK